MTLTEIRSAYPKAHRLIARLVEESGVHHRAFEGLTTAALARIEAGDTTERDARMLLMARSQARGRR